MGANAVNTMAEAVAPLIEQLSGGHVYLRIISNLATKRLAKAWCTIPKESLGGEAVVDGIAYASAFAAADPYRGPSGQDRFPEAGQDVVGLLRGRLLG